MAETYTIHNGAWTRMTKGELMKLPWFHASATEFEFVLINSCIGFRVRRVYENGTFLDLSNNPMYIEQNKDRLRLVELYWDEDVQDWRPLNTTLIRTAENADQNGYFVTRTNGVYRYDEK